MSGALRFVQEHGAIIGTVFQNRDGSATAYSIHPALSGGPWSYRAPSPASAEIWIRAAHDQHRQKVPQTA